MNDLVVVAAGWLLVMVVFLSFLTLRRYMEHRERMAMILRGITPPEKPHNTLPRPRLARRAGVLQGGLITAMIGLALTLGLYPVGFLVPPSLTTPNRLGPWLLAGLIPLAVGIALILGHYLTPGRPIDLPPGEREMLPDEQAQSSQRPGVAEARALPKNSLDGEPLSLPETRRWTLYRRESAPPSEYPTERDDKEQDKQAHL